MANICKQEDNGLEEFWLQSNNGKKFSLQNLKDGIKKSDLKSDALKNIFDFFNKNNDEILDKNELGELFEQIANAAQSDGGNEKSVFETAEAHNFIENSKNKSGKTLKDLGVKSAEDLFKFLSGMIKEEDSSANKNQNNNPLSNINTHRAFDGITSIAEKAELNLILNGKEYFRTQKRDNLGRIVTVIKDLSGKDVGKIRGDGVTEIYRSTENGITGGSAYTQNGDILYDFEYNDNVQGKYKKQTRYYTDRIEETDNDGNVKTYAVRYVAGGEIVKGKLKSSVTNEYDSDGNLFSQTTIDYENNTKTVLDSKINGYMYNKNGEKIRKINTNWDETGTRKVYQTIEDLSDNSVKTVLFSSPEELSDAVVLAQTREFALGILKTQVKGALLMMEGLENGMGFLDKATDGFLNIGDLLTDGLSSLTTGNKSNAVTSQTELKSKLLNLNAALTGLSSNAPDFDEKFREITGKEFSKVASDLILLQNVTSVYNEIEFYKAASSNVDKFVNKEVPAPNAEQLAQGKQVTLKDRLEYAKKLAAALTGNKVNAEIQINAIAGYSSEEAIERELAKYLKELQKPIDEKIADKKNKINYDVMPEQIKLLQEKVFGKNVAESVQDLGTVLSVGKMAWITAFTMGAASSVTASAGFTAFAEGLAESHGAVASFLTTKLIATTVGAAASAALTAADNISSDDGTAMTALKAGAEGALTGMEYGIFGAFVSGPSGEVCKKFLQAMSSNSGKIMQITSNILGAGTETSLDVLFDRLTSDLSIKESLKQNGGMNFAMMIVGGQINRNIKIKANIDGTYTLSDGAKSTDFKSKNELFKHIFGNEFIGISPDKAKNNETESNSDKKAVAAAISNSEKLDFEPKEPLAPKPAEEKHTETDYSKMSDDELIAKHNDLYKKFVEEDDIEAYNEAKKIQEEVNNRENFEFYVDDETALVILAKTKNSQQNADVTDIDSEHLPVTNDDFAPEGAEYKVVDKDFVTTVVYYDKNDNQIRKVLYNFNDTLQQYYDFEYNQNGTIKNESQYNYKKEKVFERIYSYNADGDFAFCFVKRDNVITRKEYADGMYEEYSYDNSGTLSAITLKNEDGFSTKKVRYTENGKKAVVEYDYSKTDRYSLTPDEIKYLNNKEQNGMNSTMAAFELKCRSIDKADKVQVENLIKNLKRTGSGVGAEIARYIDEHPKVDLAELNKYIESIDMESVYKLAPMLKYANARNMLAFYNYHFKENTTKFTVESLILKEDFTDYLGKNYTDADDMEKLLTIFPCTNRNVGTLPADWTYITRGRENLKEDVYNAIEKFRKKACEASKKRGAEPEYVWELQNTLTYLLSKDVYVSYIGSGTQGAGYKIEVKGAKDTVLKIFHKKPEFTDSKHGALIETQTGLFLNNNSDAFVPLLFGRVSIKNNRDGFLVTEYLNNVNTGKWEDTNLSNNSDVYIFTEDASGDHNIREDKVMDFGDIYVVKSQKSKYDL